MAGSLRLGHRRPPPPPAALLTPIMAALAVSSGCCSTSALLQHELGDVVYVELPEVGSQVAQGNTFGVVESVKVGATPTAGASCSRPGA